MFVLPEGIRYNPTLNLPPLEFGYDLHPPSQVVFHDRPPSVTQAVVASGGFSLDQSWHPNLGAGTKSCHNPGGVG